MGEIDGRHQAQRDGHRHGDDGADEDRAPEQRHRPERARGTNLIGADRCLRAPLQAGEEFHWRHQLEEADRFKDQRQHDAERGEDRHNRRHQQQGAHLRFDPVAGAEIRAQAAPAPKAAHRQQGHRQRAGEQIAVAARRRIDGRQTGRERIEGLRQIAVHQPAHFVQQRFAVVARRRAFSGRQAAENLALDQAFAHDAPAGQHDQRRRQRQHRHIGAVINGARMHSAHAAARRRHHAVAAGSAGEIGQAGQAQHQRKGDQQPHFSVLTSIAVSSRAVASPARRMASGAATRPLRAR